MSRAPHNRIPLVSGAYQSRSLIAGAQRCVNLYPEQNPDEQAPTPVTHYPTPGLTLFGTPPAAASGRGAFRASNGDLYVVVGQTLYFVDPAAAFTVVGQVADLGTPVSIADNGLVILIVDGTSVGYVVDMATRDFSIIMDPNFLGGSRVDYIDTYFAIGIPGEAQFFISLSEVTFAMLTNPVAGSAFDPLDTASKTGSPDIIVGVISVHGVLWLIGTLTTEIWYNSGASDFTFERQPGAFIEHGCVAPYSIAKQDVSVFWLSQDRQGNGIVVKGSGYNVERVSTHAIEAAFQTYVTLEDAVGYCFQQQGHAFYVITFPRADVTWAYELTTGQWHELAWTDQNGGLHRHRTAACCFAYGRNLIVDWQNGTIYDLDPNTYTDAGNPVVRIRTFPHMINNGFRVLYRSMIIDMQTGDSPDNGGLANLISLRWSDTRGATWSNPITQDIGEEGEYGRSLMFRRLGMARDRVFEISWTVPLKTALNGAFVETSPCVS